MKTTNNIFDKIDAVMKAVVLILFAGMVMGFASCGDDEEDEDTMAGITEQQTASLALPGIEEHEGNYAVIWHKANQCVGGMAYTNNNTYLKVSKQTGDSLAAIVKQAFLKDPTVLDFKIGLYDAAYVDAAGVEYPGEYTAELEYEAGRQAVRLTINGNHMWEGNNCTDSYFIYWNTPDLADTKTWKLISGLGSDNQFIHE